MENSALDFEGGDLSVTSAVIERPFSQNETAHPPIVSVPLANANMAPHESQRRRKRFRNFIALESAALALLVLVMIAGTSQRFIEEKLTTPFLIVILVMTSLVGLIPVLFYGLPRHKYRYHSRRPRSM